MLPFLILCGLGFLLYITYGKKLLAEGRSGHIKIAIIALGLIILLAVATGRANVLMAPLGAAMALITRFGRFAPLLLRFFPQLKDLLGRCNERQRAPRAIRRLPTQRTFR